MKPVLPEADDPFEALAEFGPPLVKALMDVDSRKAVVVRDALHILVGRPRKASRTVFMVEHAVFEDIYIWVLDRPRSAQARKHLEIVLEAMKRAIKRL